MLPSTTTRRAFIAIAATFFVVACTEQVAVVDKKQSSQLTITDVQIDTSNLQVKKNGAVRTGRDFPLSKAKLAADLDAATTRIVKARNLHGPVKAILKITPTEVVLVSPGQAWAVGGRSNIQGLVSLVSVNGKEILAPTTLKAHSTERRATGLIGAMTSPDAATDYQQTVDGFANNAVRKLFEDVTVGMDGAIIN